MLLITLTLGSDSLTEKKMKKKFVALHCKYMHYYGKEFDSLKIKGYKQKKAGSNSRFLI